MRESERVPVFYFEKTSDPRLHNAANYELDYLGAKFLKAEEL